MENSETTTTISSAPNPVGQKVHRYAVWAVLPDHVSNRIKKVMEGLRDEFGGPEIQPHIPVLGSIHSKEDDIVRNFKEACGKTACYTCTVVDVLTGRFYYQNVYLFIHPDQVSSPTGNFNYCFDRLVNMPHLSLLYGDLTDEEKEKAKEKVMALDDGMVGLTFTITRFALYKCNKDRTQKSWEKIAEHSLPR